MLRHLQRNENDVDDILSARSFREIESMGKRVRILAVLAFSVLLCLPAPAWGPKSQLAIVTTASHLLARSVNVPLTRFSNDLRNGSMVSQAQMQALYPNLGTNVVSAIESEMYLLQAVKGSKVDPYFAFRLGALGKLVANATAPMRDVKATYRNLYYADVEGNIKSELKQSKRRKVSPRDYFNDVMAQARRNDALILREYETGVGFNGVARATLPDAASLSVMAVADVWYTILTGNSVPGGVSDVQLRAYVLKAYAFYVARGNAGEIDAAAKRFDTLVTKTPDMQVQIGDMFYGANFPERAMREYEAVLAVTPDRRDVIKKISDYYMRLGEEALRDGRLESALQDFNRAIAVNPLHPTAQARKIDAEKLISERNARLAKNQQALEQAAEFEALAESEVKNRRFAEGIVLLNQALASYLEVTNEFPVESRKGEQGAADVRSRIDMLKRELVANTQRFSGSGFGLDAPMLARDAAQGLDEKVLRELLHREYETTMDTLEESMNAALGVQP